MARVERLELRERRWDTIKRRNRDVLLATHVVPEVTTLCSLSTKGITTTSGVRLFVWRLLAGGSVFLAQCLAQCLTQYLTQSLHIVRSTRLNSPMEYYRNTRDISERKKIDSDGAGEALGRGVPSFCNVNTSATGCYPHRRARRQCMYASCPETLPRCDLLPSSNTLRTSLGMARLPRGQKLSYTST